jgi:uncharacterized RDD family membrane protein YckC
MSIWYYMDVERQRQGPLSTDELRQSLRLQVFDLDTLVWRDGMLQWRPLRELAEQLNLLPEAQPAEALATAPGPGIGLPAMPPPPPPVALAEPETVAPPLSGRAVFDLGSDPSEAPAALAASPQRGEAHVADSATANPYQASRASLRSRGTALDDQGVVYAGFWKRAAALIVDGFIIGIVGGLGGEALGSLLGDVAGGSDLAVASMILLSTLALNVCYFAFFHSAVNGATPGKLLIGIKVVRGNGEAIGFWHAVARYFATIPSSIILGIGYLMAAFTPRRRALHDMICDTVVVDRWAFTRHSAMQRHELGTAATVVLSLYFLLMLALFVLAIVVGVNLPRVLR